MPNTDKVIAELAAKLGVSADHLWQALLAQQRIDGVYYSFLCLLLIVVAWAVISRVCGWLDKEEEDGFSLVVRGCVYVVTFIAVMGFGYWALTDLMNPSFSALYDLLHVGK